MFISWPSVRNVWKSSVFDLNAMITLDTFTTKSSRMFKFSKKNAKLFSLLWAFIFLFSNSLAPDFSFLFFVRVQFIALQSTSLLFRSQTKGKIIAEDCHLSANIYVAFLYFCIELSQESQVIERKLTAQMMENLHHMYSQAAKWDFWHFIQTCPWLVFVSSSYCSVPINIHASDLPSVMSLTPSCCFAV